jgi:FAD/FMN-containing dehydrogenase
VITFTKLWEDLRRMNKVVVDREAKTVTAQGGCKMAQLESAAYAERLAIVTGVVNETGKGHGRFDILLTCIGMGIALGAGLGWLSGQYGYMVDNIISARVVLADSSIITASKSENPDLVWPIRGTGGGFGVVTELVFRAYDQGPVFAFVNTSCLFQNLTTR